MVLVVRGVEVGLDRSLRPIALILVGVGGPPGIENFVIHTVQFFLILSTTSVILIFIEIQFLLQFVHNLWKIKFYSKCVKYVYSLTKRSL